MDSSPCELWVTVRYTRAACALNLSCMSQNRKTVRLGISLTTRAAMVGVVCLCDWPCLKKKRFRFARGLRRHHHLVNPLGSPDGLFFLFYLHSFAHLPLLPIIKNMTAIVDLIDAAADRIRDDELLADKKRVTHSFPPSTTPLTHAPQFESFKLGGAPPALLSQSSRRHSHSRSHSRNVSVSISVSPSLSFSSSFHDISLSSSSNSISSLSQPGPTAKRNSHHRRRSSVSTRRESAEVMGVALPTLSTSNSEDNMNLGDKDSIRRRALWALEGKPSPDGFSPVEIPELSTPEIERRMSELRMFISVLFVPQLTPRYSEQAIVSSLHGQLYLRFEWPRQHTRLI
jgi:hypothetical protein